MPRGLDMTDQGCVCGEQEGGTAKRSYRNDFAVVIPIPVLAQIRVLKLSLVCFLRSAVCLGFQTCICRDMWKCGTLVLLLLSSPGTDTER